MIHSIVYSFFFFSSRRRHTRCGRDWSSDVCSSDLHSSELNILAPCVQLMFYFGNDAKPKSTNRPPNRALPLLALASESHERSEERRVGKECRCWWWTER